MRASVVAVLLLACATAQAQPSPAPLAVQPIHEPPLPIHEPPVGWSIAAGVATGLVSMAVGGALCATDDRTNKEAGTYVMMTGLALAPVVSHLTSREWGRAAIFGALPTLSLAAMTALLEVHPAVLDEGNKDVTRIYYAVFVAISVVSSAGGLVDSFWAGERARKLTIAPTVAPNQLGLVMGGSF